MCRLSWNLGASTSWNAQGLFRAVQGLLYLYYNRISCYTQRSFPWSEDRWSKSVRMSALITHTAQCLVLKRHISEHTRRCMFKYQPRNNLWRKQRSISLHLFQDEPEHLKVSPLNQFFFQPITKTAQYFRLRLRCRWLGCSGMLHVVCRQLFTDVSI